MGLGGQDGERGVQEHRCGMGVSVQEPMESCESQTESTGELERHRA